MRIEEAVDKFKDTNKWQSYSEQTRRQYSYLLDNSMELLVKGSVQLKDLSLYDVDKYVCSDIYTMTSERGVTVANQTKTAFTALFTTMTGANPFRGAEIRPSGKTSVSVDHVRTFLTAAYSKFKWRNAGLLVQMVYELGQNVNDLLELRWSDIDFNDDVVVVKGVALRASEDLSNMLAAQHHDFGFQEWVAPNPHIHKHDGYTPYGQTQISRTIKKIREYARLPDAFNMMEVRRMGFMAMLSDGYTDDEMKLLVDAPDDREFRRTIRRLRLDTAGARG